jgi:tRNA dimethylallyltransferase
MEISLDTIGSARAVLIAGPTASGKSAAALELAEDSARRGRAAWIVNADSMQTYDALRILTARPSAEEERRIPHRLYGHVPAAMRYSVGAWLRDMEAVLKEAEAAGALPVVVGGTGLYFEALTEGIADIPDTPSDLRRRWAERLKAQGAADLQGELLRRDSAAAEAVGPKDPQRLLRALEVLDATGISIGEWRRARAAPPLLPAERAARYVLEPDRATLYRRIDERFEGMVAKGALAEVTALLRRDLDPDLPVMKAIGVRAFAAALSGESPVEAAVAQAKMESRRYAKRQLTWFRHRMRDWPRVTG